MTDFFIRNATFAKRQGVITAIGYIYKSSEPAESGGGDMTSHIKSATMINGHIVFSDIKGDRYTVISRLPADYSDAEDGYDEILLMAGVT
jgi:hypothetical protein